MLSEDESSVTERAVNADTRRQVANDVHTPQAEPAAPSIFEIKEGYSPDLKEAIKKYNKFDAGRRLAKLDLCRSVFLNRQLEAANNIQIRAVSENQTDREFADDNHRVFNEQIQILQEFYKSQPNNSIIEEALQGLIAKPMRPNRSPNPNPGRWRWNPVNWIEIPLPESVCIEPGKVETGMMYLSYALFFLGACTVAAGAWQMYGADAAGKAAADGAIASGMVPEVAANLGEAIASDVFWEGVKCAVGGGGVLGVAGYFNKGEAKVIERREEGISNRQDVVL